MFYSAPSEDSQWLKQVFEHHTDKIKKMIKKPFNPDSERKEGAELIAEEEYVCSYDEKDKIMIRIYKGDSSQIQS